MGKASSNKKVQRAAKAGGGRARAAGERNLLFPAALALVVILGTLLVVYAREDRLADAQERPLAFEDHWHSAYGFYVCDEFVPQLPEFTAPQNGGNHTHGDGLIHVHPFSEARSGANANMVNWVLDAGTVLGGDTELDDETLGVPAGETYVEGEDTCEGLEGGDAPIVQIAVWDSAFSAAEDDDPDEVVTSNFEDVRFDDDGMAYTIAFAPEGAEIPPPPSVEALESVGADLGVPTDEIPEDAELDEDFGEPEADTGDTTDTTAPAETDTTDPAEDGSDEPADESPTTDADS